MEAVALARYVRMSPRKIRRVADLIRGRQVDYAINVLLFTPKAAAKPLEKVLRSAVANLVNNKDVSEKIDPEKLIVKDINIDGGPTLKRFRAASMGRVMRIRRRTSHIKISVSTE